MIPLTQVCRSCGSKKCCAKNTPPTSSLTLGAISEEKPLKTHPKHKPLTPTDDPPLIANFKLTISDSTFIPPPSKLIPPTNTLRRTTTQPVTIKEKSTSNFTISSIFRKIQNLKIESVTFQTMTKLHVLERQILDGIMLFELTGKLPEKMSDDDLRKCLTDVRVELDRWWEIVKEGGGKLALGDDFKSLERQIQNTRTTTKKISNVDTRRLLDPTECKDVVINIIKDPTLFLDIQYLANGSYGTVYTARYYGQFTVVVKVLNGKLWDSSATERDFFFNEVNSMMLIQGHENILPILGALPYDERFPEEWKTNPDGIQCRPHAIVMPMMPNGTLEDVLEKNHEEGKRIPLQRQFEITFDICEGMGWVSSRNIIHKDFKPENVFFDKNWICKIGDVGMAEFAEPTKHAQTSSDQQLHWWTAPEIINKEKPTSKSDVYSCAFVLWQLFTDTPTIELLYNVFPSEVTYEYHKYILEGLRPPLDPEHPYLEDKPALKDNPELRKIIQTAWDANPVVRPSFEQLLMQLKGALIHSFFPASVCPDAGPFWEKYFSGSVKAPFKVWLGNLQRELEMEVTTSDTECLCRLICQKEQDQYLVPINGFSQMVKWFGPLKRSENTFFMSYLSEVLQQNWFFGPISAEESEIKLRELQDPEPGTFLVRLNLNPEGNKPIHQTPFIITRITAINPLTLAHTRIYNHKEHGFVSFLQIGGTDTTIRCSSPSIIDFIQFAQSSHPGLFCKVCPGCPYKDLFRTLELSPYEEVGDKGMFHVV